MGRGGEVRDAAIRVLYSRPQLKGRDLIGSESIPYGKIWRLGANEATEITFLGDVNFGGTDVEAGTYTVYVIPTEAEWTVLLNKKVNTWGGYTYDEAMEVARVSADVQATPEKVEALSIIFQEMEGGANMIMAWDDVMTAVPVKF